MRQFSEYTFQVVKIIFKSPKLIYQKLSYEHPLKDKRLSSHLEDQPYKFC